VIDWVKASFDSGDAKTFLLILFFSTFVGIVLYVYSNKNRSRRLESYKNIPLEDDDVNHRKEKDHE
jgi:cbb3-type cytochrome oxidase subunit 3